MKDLAQSVVFFLDLRYSYSLSTIQKPHKDILSEAFGRNNALNRTRVVAFPQTFSVFLIKTMPEFEPSHNSALYGPPKI